MCLSRFGGDLLSHVLRRSTIGATALNGRVRDGIGCFARAMTTKPRKTHAVRFRFGKDTIQVSIPGRVCFLIRQGWAAWLLLDQIKPIGQLVPVS